MSNITIKYSYNRGIEEIKKAWNIIHEGRIGIGKITHNLLLQSTERKPITLKQIAEDSGINYSTLKTYHGYYVDIIKHLPPKEQKRVTTSVLNRTSKEINRILGKGHNGKTRKGFKPKPSLTAIEMSPKEIRNIYRQAVSMSPEAVKKDRLLRNGYEIVGYLQDNELTKTELAEFSKLARSMIKEIK